MKRNIVFISALVSVVLLTVGLPVAGQTGTSNNSKTTRAKSGSRPMIAKNSVVVT